MKQKKNLPGIWENLKSNEEDFTCKQIKQVYIFSRKYLLLWFNVYFKKPFVHSSVIYKKFSVWNNYGVRPLSVNQRMFHVYEQLKK